MTDTNQTETTAAFNTLRAALQADQDYAWSWHCNIAMASFDAGCSHEVANRGAARFMSTCFGIDVTKFKEFQGFEPQWAESAKAPTQFATDLQRFNTMYRMPVSKTPTVDVDVAVDQRLTDFRHILGKELDEIEPIIKMAEFYRRNLLFTLVKDENGDLVPREFSYDISSNPTNDELHQVTARIKAHRFENLLDLLTALADLLGDIQVYCGSEMAKFGLPLDAVLDIIMQSNFSKMGADGNPIYDERNKLQKGPDYWKPEPKLRSLLASLLQSCPSS